jgi:FKBP-type peptidyl-prolyl cis-trans isomerase
MTRFVQQSLLAAALAAVLGVASAADEPAKKPATPAIAPAKDAKPPVAIDKNKISTMVGMDIGRGLTQIKDDIDIKVVEQALEQTLKGEKTSLTQEEALQVRQAYMQQMQAKRVAEQKAAAEKNKTEGEAFLAKNKSKSGVKTTASGLQYEVEKEGTGPKPKATDTVKVNYLGTKIDGTKFDSSYDRGQSRVRRKRAGPDRSERDADLRSRAARHRGRGEAGSRQERRTGEAGRCEEAGGSTEEGRRQALTVAVTIEKARHTSARLFRFQAGFAPARANETSFPRKGESDFS